MYIYMYKNFNDIYLVLLKFFTYPFIFGNFKHSGMILYHLSIH